MKRLLLNKRTTKLCLLLLSVLAQHSFALSTDKDQDIEIQADSAVLDEENNISIYTGNVIVTQGSIYMTGDKMTVHNTDDDELEVLIMEGNPATHRQLPDNSEIYDESRAQIMEYYELKNLIYLIKDAWSKQGDGEISGDRIEYDTVLNKAKAWSEPGSSVNVKKDGKPKQRVKIVIRKNNKSESEQASGE